MTGSGRGALVASWWVNGGVEEFKYGGLRIPCINPLHVASLCAR